MKALLDAYADKLKLLFSCMHTCIMYTLYNDCYTIEYSQIDIFGCDKLLGIMNRNKTHWAMIVITHVHLIKWNS